MEGNRMDEDKSDEEISGQSVILFFPLKGPSRKGLMIPLSVRSSRALLRPKLPAAHRLPQPWRDVRLRSLPDIDPVKLAELVFIDDQLDVGVGVILHFVGSCLNLRIQNVRVHDWRCVMAGARDELGGSVDVGLQTNTQCRCFGL